MNKAGVGILAGTDADGETPFIVPGFGLHDELATLVRAGLSPMEALQSVTLNPARYLGRDKNAGTIEKGKAADVILLDANPVEDINNTRKIHAVPARSPCSRSGSAAWQRRLRPRTASSGRYGWRRPRLRVYPAKPKVGLRTTGADEMWHIDTTVIRLLDGTRAYLHAVIDNFSRRILAWRVANTFAPVNSVAVLLEASRGATRSASAPVVVADAGVENVNAQVDALIDTGVLRRLLAFTELKFSNSMIEAWWRS